MNDDERRAEIVRALQHATTAHRAYEIAELNGEYDQQWSGWYAEYMIAHGWNALWSRTWRTDELAEQLRRADVEQRARAPLQRWEEYYAEFFLSL